MNSRSIVLLASAAVLLSLSSVAQTKSGSTAASLPAAHHLAVRPEAVRWTPMSSDLMEGTPAFALTEPPQVSLLEGDPSQAGAPFTLRIRLAAGTRVPPHWHPTEEHITVLQGRFSLGMGDEYNAASLQELPTGSYASMPKGMTHFALATGDTIVQVHGVGPFKSVWVGSGQSR
ncbi:MAG TPA: cupin domain-containing protein [Vicinamibacteria bacterium]|jgi:quercetin dioxygenase-like cupin family protein